MPINFITHLEKLIPTFDQVFTVKASVEEVAVFHSDTSALKKINPPLVFMELHRVDPMDEGSISEFTLWMGPLPVR